ncbi:MAG TPA: Scr1 family TA system antitoxin-like transcriptional regulator, partial [Micromonosporaceae bacterium]
MIVGGVRSPESQMSACHLADTGWQAARSGSVAGDADAMSNVDSPAVARRRVRLALRAFRTSKKLTQSQVAKAMDWSLSKVIRIEKGEVNVSPSDLKVLLEHLEVTDQATVEELLEDVRLSRTERWTISAADREYITPAMLQLAQFEADAVQLRYYNNLLVPGTLQTEAYARTILGHSGLDSASIERRVAFRMRRRERVERSSDPPCFVLLDESVLLRRIGEPMVMVDQLDLIRSL